MCSSSPTSSRVESPPKISPSRPPNVAQHCPECGFANDDGAAYCQRCGAFLAQGEPPPGVTTATYKVDESGDVEVVELQDVIAGGAALGIRSGGGREGESFALERDRMSVGRSPESDVFLDDVTVSRDHALIVRRGSDWFLDDCGSLNGTYVNRRRSAPHRLTDGDELQIGKYKLAFLSR